mmetsp:Transcript_37280/g.93999  ORF Transcript_37280/g.93999 Transcript_37280/m.93999 type:complete len:384 (-) Transcript_37280:142-1293(-)
MEWCSPSWLPRRQVPGAGGSAEGSSSAGGAGARVCAPVQWRQDAHGGVRHVQGGRGGGQGRAGRGLPPPGLRRRVRHRGRGGRGHQGVGRAARSAIHHLQAVERGAPAGARARRVREEPGRPGVRPSGPVPGALARRVGAWRQERLWRQRGGGRHREPAGHVARDGGAGGRGPGQGHRRVQLQPGAGGGGAGGRARQAGGQPGGAAPTAGAAQAHGRVLPQGRAVRGLLAAGRAGRGRRAQPAAGPRGRGPHRGAVRAQPRAGAAQVEHAARRARHPALRHARQHRRQHRGRVHLEADQRAEGGAGRARLRAAHHQPRVARLGQHRGRRRAQAHARHRRRGGPAPHGRVERPPRHEPRQLSPGQHGCELRAVTCLRDAAACAK